MCVSTSLKYGFIKRSISVRGIATHPHETLYPPKVLYRRILRAHKVLPPAQKAIGDAYVKNEFKLHKDIDNPLHIVGFLASWQDYLRMIDNGRWSEGTMSKETLEKLSPEQIGQLYELMKETKRVTESKVDNEALIDASDEKQLN